MNTEENIGPAVVGMLTVTAKPKKPKAKKKPSKLAKAARPDKSKAKKAVKPKTKKAKKTARSTRKRVLKNAKAARPIERTERLDMRITKAQKAKLNNKAAGLKRTVTSVVLEAIDKLK